MLREISHDARLYLRLIAMQLRAQWQYKANVAFDILTYFSVTTLEFTQIFLVFGAFGGLAGWSAGEVAVLYGVTNVSFGLAELFGGGIDSMDEVMRRGDFDRVLLRPVRPFLQMAGAEFRLRRLGRLTQGMMAFGVGVALLGGLSLSPLKVAALALGTLSTALIFIAILTLGAVICFWTIQTSELTNILTYGGRETLSWPLSIYSRPFQAFFLFVAPLAFGSYGPTCYLLGKPLSFGLPAALTFAAPLVALAFAALTSLAWRFGVRHYQSTGS